MDTGLIFGIAIAVFLTVQAIYEIIAKAPLIGAASYYGKYTESSIHKAMPLIGLTSIIIAAGLLLFDLSIYEVLGTTFCFVGFGIILIAAVVELIVYKKVLVKKTKDNLTEEYKDMD